MSDRPAVQRSFDDLGPPLSECTFAVIDLETTGGSADRDAITEVAAVRVRGGEVLTTLSSLVNPGRAVPPTITVLTGITTAMVARAPRIEEVLDHLLEVLSPHDVIVGHNVRFDVGFLRVALERHGAAPLANRTVDTAALARRLLGEEVPNCKLSTLARALRLPHQPCHRALDDVRATVDLLHVLLERAAGLGVMGLEDLLTLPTMAGHPQAAKLALTQRLPHRAGVYLFRDGRGRVLYVGKATDLRARVRSYFGRDERRKVGGLLREVQRIDHKVCSGLLEAEVLESRLIRDLTPRYNSRGTRWRSACYLRLTTEERFPRLSVVKQAPTRDGFVLGPLRSHAVAREVADAIESSVPLRRCTARIGAATTRPGACAAAQIGVATCPCTGEVREEDYLRHVHALTRAVDQRPSALLDPLSERMRQLAAQERFEEAALARNRLRSLAGALRRRRDIDQLVACERLVLATDDGLRVELRRGILWAVGERPRGDSDPDLWAGTPADAPLRPVEMRPSELPVPGRAVPKGLADELACVATWLRRRAASLRIEHVEGTFASAVPPVPDVPVQRARR